LIFLTAQGQEWSPASAAHAQASRRDAGAFLWAFRALKRTAKLRPSLRDEEVSAFSEKDLGNDKALKSRARINRRCRDWAA
jgi:hypothetical protein